MIKIRLTRLGSKKRPFYRIVAVDERQKRDGAYLELLGTYNPLTEPKEIRVDQKKVEAWIKKGAVLSDGYLRLTGKAPHRPLRKPKKAKTEAPITAASEAKQNEVAEGVSIEETVAEPSTGEAPAETAEAVQDREAKEEIATTSEPESDKINAIREGK